MKMPIRFFPLAVSIALAAPSSAAVLQQAKITHIVRDVRTVDPGKPPRPATVGETVQGQRSVRTGIESRTELLFNEQTISRIGANSQFSFSEGTREMTFLRGAMLLQVPKGGGGATIHTPAVTCAVPGTTILIEAGPGFTKLIVIEGKAILTANADRLRRKTTVTAGQEVIMPNTATIVPPPVSVNLSVLAKTSRLVSGTWTAKLDESRITAAITTQAKQTFTETNIAIVGLGTEVVFIPERPAALPPPAPNPAPPKFGPPTTNSGNFVINNTTTIRTDPIITTGTATGFGTIYQSRAIDGPATNFVLGSGATDNAAFDTEFEKLSQPAVFRFENLTLAGSPAIDTSNGPTNLTLASVGAITSGGGAPQTIDLSALQSLTLAAIGPILLGPELTITGTGTRLWLDDRTSGGSITVNSTINLPTLQMDAGNQLTFGGSASVTDGIWNSVGNMNIAGVVKATGSLQMNSLGEIALAGPITATGLQISAQNIDLVQNSAASIDAVTFNARTLQAATLSKTGTSAFFNGVPIKLTRLTSLDLSAPSFNVQNALAFGNSVDVNLTGAISGAGGVTGRNVTFGGPATLTGDVTARGTINGSSISGRNFNFVGPATFSGDVSASGGVNAFSTIKAGNVSGSSNNDINFLGDATLTGDVTSAGGRIRATANISAVNISTSGPLQFEGDANFTGNVTTGLNNDMRIRNLTVGGTLTTRIIRPAHGDQPSVVNTLTASSGTVLNIQTGIDFSPRTANDDIIPSGSALSLTIRSSGNVLFGAGGINEAAFNGGSASLGSNNPGGSGGTLQVEAQGDITVNTGPGTGAFGVQATTGANAGTAQSGGKGGTVNLISENGTVAVNALVVVSSNDILPSRVKSSSGGNIKLQSGKPSGTAIAVGVNVTNSADLRALLDAAAPGPGGRIEFIATKGGDILVNRFNGITADRGTIDIRSTGGPAGLVSLDGVRIAADVVKVGALGDNGVLRIGGGSIDAATTMRLYAGGTNGTVDFIDNVTLSGAATKTIAGRTVNIANGKAVNVTGPAATVFTTVPNYTGSGGNGSKTGQFTGTGATTLPLNHPSKPGF